MAGHVDYDYYAPQLTSPHLVFWCCSVLTDGTTEEDDGSTSDKQIKFRIYKKAQLIKLSCVLKSSTCKT